MVNEYTIRNTTPDDVLRLKEINEICLPENYPIDFWTYILCNFSQTCFVLFHNGENRPVGYILGVPNMEPYPSISILSFAIMKEHRGRGWGKRLISRIKETIPMIQLSLHVRESNPAKHLYQREGFHVVKTEESYYEDGENGLLMLFEPLRECFSKP